MQKVIFIILITVLLVSCTSEDQIRQSADPDLFDGKYDSEFPYKSSSEQLEEISNTIRIVNSIAFYRTYNFERNDNITTASIRKGGLSKFLETTTSLEETASGTGTIIFYSGNTVAVLTCAHIVNFPDSVTTFFTDADGKSTGFLQSFSVKVKQDIYVVPFFEEGDFEIVIQDKVLDIAILKKKINNTPLFQPQKLTLPVGNAKELRWGSFVYLFGFPINYKMISKGIVSSPDYDNKGSFIIDAVVNQGMSGGIVFAIRDGVPNFELVGMILFALAENEYVLRPQKDQILQLGSEYKGPLIADKRKNIKYGITKVLAIEQILEFINENSDVLMKNGINPERIFK